MKRILCCFLFLFVLCGCEEEKVDPPELQIREVSFEPSTNKIQIILEVSNYEENGQIVVHAIDDDDGTVGTFYLSKLLELDKGSGWYYASDVVKTQFKDEIYVMAGLLDDKGKELDVTSLSLKWNK